MDNYKKAYLCTRFFENLVFLLDGKYELVQSCNGDFSKYLVPIGSSCDITYYGKPADSFRISDHWNWYSNINKCSNLNYIQCLNVDLPWAKPRKDEKATRPIIAYQVALIGSDGKYHSIYGETYNRNKHKWTWKESDPKEVIEYLFGGK